MINKAQLKRHLLLYQKERKSLKKYMKIGKDKRWATLHYNKILKKEEKIRKQLENN